MTSKQIQDLSQILSRWETSVKNEQALGRIPVLDSHCHVFPDSIAVKSRDAVSGYYGLTPYTYGSISELEKTMKNLPSGSPFSLLGALLCSPATSAHQSRSINRFIHEVCASDSSFLGFGTLHPENTDFDELLDEFEELSLFGVKLHPDFQRTAIDDPALFPLYESLQKRNLPVLFHMGDEHFDYSAPVRLAALLKRFPRLTVIAAHLGGYKHWDEALSLLPADSRLFFDISSSLSFLTAEVLAPMVDKFGPAQFFFGSDFPMWNPYKELTKLSSLLKEVPTLSPDSVLTGNLLAFFHGFCRE